MGNSGVSLQPHLHFQVMAGLDPFPLFANLLPFVLREAVKQEGRARQTVRHMVPANGDHLHL